MAGKRLNVVCLISGGKDSFFSILHCLKNGHNIVALANLHPPPLKDADVVDDLDSYMYQTVGHRIIPLYEQALGLPLYRQEVLGSAVNQERSYGPATDGFSTQDETEALVPLLRKVVESHPEVNAVSTGAILSDYQRTRVESVAIRLGLTPLSYLWQWPNLPPNDQASLLHDMASVGQDSRLIKVASGGLDDSFLWQSVADLATIKRLEKAVRRFGSGDDGAVLGEGGEYETISLAGPAPLWKGKLVVDENQRKTITGEAGSASLQITSARVESSPTAGDELLTVRVPPLIEPRFLSMLGHFHEGDTINSILNEARETDPQSTNGFGDRNVSDTADGQLHGHDSVFLPDITGAGTNAIDQTASIMGQVKELLQHSGHSFADVIYTSIILRDMADFATINAVYGKCFEHPNPPVRATLAAAAVLPPGKHVMISFTSTKSTTRGPLKGLHVQSRSYWAPANIGPYSQAISTSSESNDSSTEDRDLVYIAGQIPLEPASMELPSSGTSQARDDFGLQTVLAMQHFVRIGRAMCVRQWICAIAFVTADSVEDVQSRSRIARRTWQLLHSTAPMQVDDNPADDTDDDSFDVWDRKFGKARYESHQQQSSPDIEISAERGHAQMPPLFVIQVDALPRGASVEWVTYGSTSDKVTGTIQHFSHLLKTFEQHQR